MNARIGVEFGDRRDACEESIFVMQAHELNTRVAFAASVE